MSLIWTFEENVNLELVKEEFRRLALKFPRFKCTVYGGGSWSKYRWKEIKNFDISNNIKVHTLSTGTINELKECVAKDLSEKLDFTKPLWNAYIHYDLEGGKCSAMAIKMHHCIADGTGAMRALLSLTSDGEEQLLDTIKFFKERAKKKPNELPILGSRAIRSHVDKIPNVLIKSYSTILRIPPTLLSFFTTVWYGCKAFPKLLSIYKGKKSLLLDVNSNFNKVLSWTMK